MEPNDLARLLERLSHYAFVYGPGPKWGEKEAADRAEQAHLDGVEAEELADRIEAIWADLTDSKQA